MHYVSYWLMPAEPDRTFLQDMIHHLSQRYAAPSFAPHVTIYSGASSEADDPATIVAAVTQGMRRLRLEVAGIRYSPVLTKTLFVQFQESSPLASLSEAIRGLVRQPATYRLDPHLSLLYQEMRVAEQQHLAATLHLPRPSVVFDAVAAMESSRPMRTPDDVNTWQITSYLAFER